MTANTADRVRKTPKRVPSPDQKWRSVTIHADATMMGALEARTGTGEYVGQTMKEMFALATQVVREELLAMTYHFNRPEVLEIMKAASRWDAETDELKMLALEVADSNLAAKLRGLTAGQLWALIDLTNRYHAHRDQYELNERGLRRLGLIVKDWD